MKKKLITFVFIIAIFLLASLTMYNKNNSTAKKIKVADTTITSKLFFKIYSNIIFIYSNIINYFLD